MSIKRGGIEIFSFDLLEALNSKGIKADLICFYNYTGESSYNGFKFIPCKTNLILNSAPLSYDYVKKFKQLAKNYDIIHVHAPNPLAEILSLTTDIKTIIHWHSDIVKQKILYQFYRPIQRKVLERATKIIATSSQYLETSKQLKDFKNKTTVIPLGLNFKRLEINPDNTAEFRRLNLEINNKKIVLSIGRLVEYKGFEHLIEASRFLKDDVLVLIVGGGPLFNDLKEKISKLGLNHKVKLLGRVDDVSIFLKNCDLFCLPSISRNEAFGLVLVEALYFGKPLVTTNVFGSGMSYVNRHNETGLVVPPSDPKSLAEAINKILSDKGLYSRFQKNALERLKEFDINAITDRMIEIYKELLKC